MATEENDGFMDVLRGMKPVKEKEPRPEIECEENIVGYLAEQLYLDDMSKKSKNEWRKIAYEYFDQNRFWLEPNVRGISKYHSWGDCRSYFNRCVSHHMKDLRRYCSLIESNPAYRHKCEYPPYLQ